MRIGIISGAVVAFIGAVVALYQGADVIGFDLDRPAWSSELTEVAGYALEPAREQKQADLNSIKATIEELKSKRVPRRKYLYLIRQQIRLQLELKDINRLLKR